MNAEEVKKKIKEFFKREDFSPYELKKIKRLAMKYRIRLKKFKRKFCKICLYPLKGDIKVSKSHKTIKCKKCGYLNRFKIT